MDFDDLIRAGRDTEALRLFAKEYYDGNRMGHTRLCLCERVADRCDELQAKLSEANKGCEHCRGWDSRCGANYCPMCGRKLEEAER